VMPIRRSMPCALDDHLRRFDLGELEVRIDRRARLAQRCREGHRIVAAHAQGQPRRLHVAQSRGVIDTRPPFRIEHVHWREVGNDTDDLISAIQRDVARIGLAAAADVADAGAQRVPTAEQRVRQRPVHHDADKIGRRAGTGASDNTAPRNLAHASSTRKSSVKPRRVDASPFMSPIRMLY